ncbi:hypothetical protein C8Q80DRAFT_605109 [Daedaleopsis nitida]|nr:hypothetical protein C8Q80DRAFT_605109 [Daedaleopsis nitida]
MLRELEKAGSIDPVIHLGVRHRSPLLFTSARTRTRPQPCRPMVRRIARVTSDGMSRCRAARAEDEPGRQGTPPDSVRLGAGSGAVPLVRSRESLSRPVSRRGHEPAWHVQVERIPLSTDSGPSEGEPLGLNLAIPVGPHVNEGTPTPVDLRLRRPRSRGEAGVYAKLGFAARHCLRRQESHLACGCIADKEDAEVFRRTSDAAESTIC